MDQYSNKRTGYSTVGKSLRLACCAARDRFVHTGEYRRRTAHLKCALTVKDVAWDIVARQIGIARGALCMFRVEARRRPTAGVERVRADRGDFGGRIVGRGGGLGVCGDEGEQKETHEER